MSDPLRFSTHATSSKADNINTFAFLSFICSRISLTLSSQDLPVNFISNGTTYIEKNIIFNRGNTRFNTS